MLSRLTKFLYAAARLSNKARIVGPAVKDNPKPLLRHERNRLYFRFRPTFR